MIWTKSLINLEDEGHPGICPKCNQGLIDYEYFKSPKTGRGSLWFKCVFCGAGAHFTCPSVPDGPRTTMLGAESVAVK